MRQQFRSGSSGGARVADTVGAGSIGFGKDGRKENGGWVKGAPGLRPTGQRSIAEALGAKTVKKPDGSFAVTQRNVEEQHIVEDDRDDNLSLGDLDESPPSAQPPQRPAPSKPLFQGLCFYINGSTAPLISDHKLKQIIAEHGGSLSIALGRRTVTHVIIGDTRKHGGAGGGLAGSKIQKEIQKVGGKGVKFVNAEWYVSQKIATRILSNIYAGSYRASKPASDFPKPRLQRSNWLQQVRRVYLECLRMRTQPKIR